MAELKLDLAVDARQAIRGVESFSDALSDVTDDFKDIDKAGDKTERSLEDSFRDIAKAGKKAGDDAGDGLSKGLKSGTKDGLKDAGAEAHQSGREAAASFSGEFGDVADFMQETLANALGGFGPIGSAAGVILASALGAALSAAQATQEKLDEARQAAADLAQTLYQNGGKLPIEDAISNVLALLPTERSATNPFENLANGFIDLGTNIDAVKTAARLAKVPVNDFVRGLSGSDLDQTAKAIKRTKDALQELQDAVNKGTDQRPLIEVAGEEAQLKSLLDQLEKVQSTADIADQTVSAVGSSFDSAAYTEQVAAIGQAWQDAMVDAGDYISEQNGVTTFDWSAYLKGAEETLAAANQYKADIVTLPADIKSEAESIFSSQGAKAAEAYVKAYQGASTTDKARFVAAAKQNGEAAGKAQGEALATEAATAAKAKAAAMSPVVVPTKPAPIDWASVTRNPPTVYVPGVIVKPGTRQPL